MQNNKWVHGLGLGVAFLVSTSVWAGPGSLKIVDDSDLTGRVVTPVGRVDRNLTPDAVKSDEGAAGAAAIGFFREDHGVIRALDGLLVRAAGSRQAKTEKGVAVFSCRDRERIEVVVELADDRFFAVTDGDSTYRVSAAVDCGKKLSLMWKSDSNGGQALGIWQVAARAKDKLEKNVGLAFWNSRITFNWPGSGDYYSFNTVNLTRGDHWDVVGHEMGHAIYDQADIGVFGGGSHRIDECYSTALALSEGWASYFSGWVSVELTDADAKFEYMVPRRAPIRFENVPSDVCRGQTNEWRVNSFFWDLNDLNDDSEKADVAFTKTWRALEKAGLHSADDARKRLVSTGAVSSEWADLVWKLNF